MSYNTFSPIITDGLVLCLDAMNTKSYPGSGNTWSDLSKNLNNATLYSGATFNSTIPQSIVFDGTNDYAEVSNSSSLNSSAGTISVWFKYTSVGGTFGASLIGKHDASGSTNGYNILVQADGNIYTQIKDNGVSQTQLSTPGAYASNTWRNIVLTYSSGTSCAVYSNGQLIVSSSCITFTMTTSPLRMIDSLDTFWGIMNANISQVLIYNKVLSAAQILQNFNATKSKFGF